MNWDAIGAGAELLGGVATVATLAYLAVQIRQSSAATRAQIRQSLADSQINYVNARATDPFLRGAAAEMLSGRELDADTRFGLGIHLIAHIRLFENYFAQYNLGTMDPEDWRAMRAALGQVLRFKPYREAFSYQRDAWNAGFVAEVERVLVEVGEPAV